jgi:hypothetical protein
MINEAGKTVARRRIYVGEQLENTGPSANHVSIARRTGEDASCIVSKCFSE